MGEVLTHRLVLDRVGGEGGAIPVDVLAQLREPLGRMRLEPSRGVGDGAREPDRVDFARGQPALLLELSHELVAVEALDLVTRAARSRRSTLRTWFSMPHWMAVVSSSTALTWF
jgi:hypothetical protein